MLPIAIAANAIPIIAIAPIFNNWFGVLNPLSKMMIAALLVFFPVMINVTRGLSQVAPSALELMRSYAAVGDDDLREAAAPERAALLPDRAEDRHHAEPHRRGRRRVLRRHDAGLGRVVVQSASGLRFDVTWAAILLVSLAGIAMYLAVVALERVLIPWHASLRGEEPS